MLFQGQKQVRCWCLFAGLILFSTRAAAVSYAPVEPYSYALGGTGVSSGTRTNAIFFNPALLATTGQSEDYALAFPIIGLRYMNTDSVVGEIDNYQSKGLESAYDNALTAFREGDYTDKEEARLEVRQAAFFLSRQLKIIDNTPMAGDFVGGLVLALPPGKKYQKALVIDTRVIGGAVVNVHPDDTAALDEVADVGTDEILLADGAFDTSQMKSAFEGRGLTITEIGLALSRSYRVFGQEIDVGITPKYLRTRSFDYHDTDLQNASFDPNQGAKSHATVDMDVGVAKHYGNGWSAGLAIKNLFGQKYESVLGNDLEVIPQARLGVSHRTDFVSVALDVDLNQSDALGYEEKTQYLAFGAELNVFDITSIRIGYRQNMSDTSTSIATTGIGFTAYGVRIDLAAGANVDEFGFAGQLLFNF